MIIWGYGGDVVDGGTAFTRQCDNCGCARDFHVMVRYRYFGLYWVFNFVFQKKVFVACEACQHGWEVEASRVMGHSARIPFMRKYGLAILVGVLALGAFT